MTSMKRFLGRVALWVSFKFISADAVTSRFYSISMCWSTIEWFKVILNSFTLSAVRTRWNRDCLVDLIAHASFWLASFEDFLSFPFRRSTKTRQRRFRRELRWKIRPCALHNFHRLWHISLWRCCLDRSCWKRQPLSWKCLGGCKTSKSEHPSATKRKFWSNWSRGCWWCSLGSCKSLQPAGRWSSHKTTSPKRS